MRSVSINGTAGFEFCPSPGSVCVCVCVCVCVRIVGVAN